MKDPKEGTTIICAGTQQGYPTAVGKNPWDYTEPVFNSDAVCQWEAMAMEDSSDVVVLSVVGTGTLLMPQAQIIP